MPTVSELFTLKYGHSLELNRLDQSDAKDAVNFVSRTARNNGVSARIRPIPDLAPAAAGTITVALGGQGGAGEAFLQPFPYYCGRDVMILTSKVPMTNQQKLWWVTCLVANRFRFGFGRQANKTLKNLLMPEPSAIPSWVTAADTNHFEGVDAPASLSITTSSNPVAIVLVTRLWKAFKYSDLFVIRKGYYNKKPPQATHHSGIPFIGASDSNNGVTGYVTREVISSYSRNGVRDESAGLENKLFESGAITVSNNGSVGEAFYQNREFTCSHDVNPLYLKDKSIRLSPEAALFLATVIRAEKYRWGYGRKWRPIRMPESVIKLPVTHGGSPDWAFMERFIKTLPYSSQLGG